MVGRDAGTSLVEVLVTVALMATVTSLGAPLVLHARDHADGRQAVLALAGQFRAARQEAILTGRNAALVFDLVDIGRGAWSVTRCSDEDGDGVLRADIAAGIDRCGDAGVLPGVGGISVAVAFGTSRIASFSPLGTSSSGSVTMTTRTGRQFVVRVSGTTGRLRVYL